jgi:hypothetical protein
MLSIIYRGHSEAGFFVHALGLSHREKPVVVLPGNRRTDDTHYACMIPILDYLRMSLSEARNHGHWHYSDLEPEILVDVRAGRAVLVFDLCNEGPTYDPSIFDEFYCWIEANSLPPGRCIWLAQNRAMSKAAQAHAGARSKLLRFDHYDFFVKVIAWLFSPSCRDNVLGIDSETPIARLFDSARKSKLLLCLNATPRLQRVLTVAALHHYGLIDGSLVSFPGVRYVKEGASMALVSDFIDENPTLEYLRPSVEAVSRMAALKVDAFEETGNALVEKIDPVLYERSFFSLVTESDFSDGSIERVSEKIAKAYCMGHPTLPVGNAGSVKFMTALGFQDWNDVLDRRAEETFDPAHRFEMVIGEVLRQASRIRSNPDGWLESVREVGAYNIRHAVSGRFLADSVTHMDIPVVDRLTALVAC